MVSYSDQFNLVMFIVEFSLTSFGGSQLFVDRRDLFLAQSVFSFSAEEACEHYLKYSISLILVLLFNIELMKMIVNQFMI